jgi:hypothetical protein
MHIEMTATDAAKKFGTYMNTALRRPVVIKKNNKGVLVTLTPQAMEDIIDCALAEQAMSEPRATAAEVAAVYKKLDDYAAQH